MQVSAFDLAGRFIGLREVSGPVSNAHVLAMLRLDNTWVEGDEVPWCSAFVNYVCWLLRLPRSKSLAARSWLTVGMAIPLASARPGYDVVILKRGSGEQPGPEILAAPGHAGFFAGLEEADPENRQIMILGGNQGDMVSVAPMSAGRLLGVRRLWTDPGLAQLRRESIPWGDESGAGPEVTTEVK